MNLKVKTQKWGNSLGMRIPKPIADELQLVDGTVLELEVDGETLILHHAKRNSYDLKELLREVTPRNIHSEIDTDDAVGEEVW
jgi:antitoxin MazE